MDDPVQPKVITAIADADFEAMVSSALYESGWSVIARPLDFRNLEISSTALLMLALGRFVALLIYEECDR